MSAEGAAIFPAPSQEAREQALLSWKDKWRTVQVAERSRWSAVKELCVECRVQNGGGGLVVRACPALLSQHGNGGSSAAKFSSKESNTLFWPLEAPAHMWYIWTHAGRNTYIQNKSVFECKWFFCTSTTEQGHFKITILGVQSSRSKDVLCDFPLIPTLESQRQEVYKFKASLGLITYSGPTWSIYI